MAGMLLCVFNFMFVWIRYHPVSQEQLTDSQCLDPVAKSELDGNRYWDQDSRPLSKVLASFHGQHPESASSLVTGLLWQDSLYWPIHTGKLVLAQFLLLPEASPAAQEGGGAGKPPRHVCTTRWIISRGRRHRL